MLGMSWGELADCQDYAEKVVAFYRLCNKGDVPTSPGDAELAVREYNKEWRSFKSLYGYTIRGYVNTIVDCIGLLVEC